MLSIGRARHPGPCTSYCPSGFSIEFLNVGGWLSRGDLALESKAHFLAVAEHRLIPARARNVTTQLRKVRRSSVWAPSCQDVTPGGHAGVGVISLHGATLSLPSFKEFFRIGRAMRVVLPLGNGGVVHLFVIYGYQGAESDPEKLQLSEHLFAAVLAEARMCCAGQPVILAGDFNADPTVIPSLAKGIFDGHWIDLERAFATGRGVLPSYTCQFQLDEGKGSRRDFVLACPTALPAATACYVLPDRWNIWDVYIREVGFVPCEVRERLFDLCNSPIIDAHFRKAWMPYFRREGHPVVTVQSFLDFAGDHLPQEPFLDLPMLTGKGLYEAAMAKKSTAAGLDGWAWNEIKALSLSWFVGQWPQ